MNYGLSQRCQLTISQTSDGKFSYRNYECRRFPTGEKDYCKEEGFQSFCIAWRSAYYLDQIALGVAAVALVAVLFGVTTHSRRRRTWRAVAGLVILTGESKDLCSFAQINIHYSIATCQITVFALVTDLYSKAAYPGFERARPGKVLAYLTVGKAMTCSLTALGYIIHTISWVLNIVIALGIITSGLSADSGHGWAAGNDAYQPIA